MNGDAMQQAWRLLEASVVTYRGSPVGTVAARDAQTDALNYDQIFTRDFAISAFAFLLDGRPEVVRHFLAAAVKLQSHQRQLDCFKPGEGLIPASFKVTDDGAGEQLIADFGEHAIARVAPVDSGFWWLLTLQAYVRVTDDQAFLHETSVQQAIRLVLDLSMTNRFDMFPTMLVPDGAFMIDRRMGVYGYPIDIQAQFFAALCAAAELLDETDPANAPYRTALDERLPHLAYHVRTYYWLDLPRPIHVCAGRVSLEKNVPAFLEADLPGSKVVVGDGPVREKLQEKYPDVCWAGYQFGEDLGRHFASGDVFVFPSRTDTFGVVMLEANACGLPVAAYPVTGPIDVVKQGITGSLNDDLRQACLDALALSPEDCRGYACENSWQRCAELVLDTVVNAQPEEVSALPAVQAS